LRVKFHFMMLEPILCAHVGGFEFIFLREVTGLFVYVFFDCERTLLVSSADLGMSLETLQVTHVSKTDMLCFAKDFSYRELLNCYCRGKLSWT
jgi:hypothetical protein